LKREKINRINQKQPKKVRLTPRTGHSQKEAQRVLVFADDPVYALVFFRELTAAGYEVNVTLSTAWGMARFKKTIEQNRPDLVLLALETHRPTSLELLPDIRLAYYDLPILLWSLHPADRYDSRAMAADYFVPAGPNLEDLKLKIRMALEA